MNVRIALLVVFPFAAFAPAFGSPKQSPPPDSMPCVEVRIGQDSAGRIDCLNRALHAELDKTMPAVTGDAASGMAPSRLGQPTAAALKQRLGNAYGHSLVPQRPPRTFAPSLPPVR